VSGTVPRFERASLFKVCCKSCWVKIDDYQHNSLDCIGFSPSLSHPISLDDEAFGYLKRVIVTPAVYPRLVEFLHFDIQSTGQKSHCVYTELWPSQCYVLIRQSDSPCSYQF
jgi:hypothetical protein